MLRPTSVVVCLLEFNSQLVFADLATIFSDATYAMLFDMLSYRPSGYRCPHLVDHWAPCLFSATATNAAFLARGSFHASEAYHYILVMHRRCLGSGEWRWRCVPAEDVKGGAVMDFTWITSVIVVDFPPSLT
ncbi:unnamed protein product [Taenia asiatica]|uniref:Secreted protein n=1 Tax=Taenia asiatica TaxID=60517 RepID=A0A0R3VV43_TAEAS|nr:unnamed protein product [Taenia asiatica]